MSEKARDRANDRYRARGEGKKESARGTPSALDHAIFSNVLLSPRRVMLSTVSDDEELSPENVMAGAQSTNSGTLVTMETVMVLTAHGLEEDWNTRVSCIV